jgi:hypothetical protein
MEERSSAKNKETEKCRATEDAAAVEKCNGERRRIEDYYYYY